MKRFTLVIIFFIVSICGAFAQNISVKSFKSLPMDLTASSLEGKRVDQNGDVAALIKVVTTETGFVFEGGTLGIVDTKQTPGEVWVWVPRAARKITIKHPQLGVLRDYYYPVEIEAERTYEMVLTTAKIETIVKEEVRMQYLAFQISPPNATLVVDEKYWDVEADGSAQDYVNFGTYSWRVEAPNYHSDAGRVTVDDPNNAKIVPVTLQPNFGWIEVAGSGNLKDASVYVDNVLIGRAPCKSEALKSGKHTVRITKKMYATYTESVNVADNETTRLAPSLAADFAEVTLTVDADADIYVNDERKGIRTWTGPLGSGTYKIECKQANHETSTTTKEITAAMEGQTITLPAPRPIYGSLNVESTPNFCNLYIDGKDMGTTPKSIAEILIGQHTVVFTKDGYDQQIETVTIAEGLRTQLKATLNKTPERPAPQANKPTNSSNGQKTSTNSQADLNALYQKINAALEAGKVMSILNDLLELDSYEHNDPSVPYILGTLYGDPINRIYDPNKAIASYQKALRINPNYYNANYNLGVLYITLANELIAQANDITGVSKAEMEQYDNLFTQSDDKLRTGLPYLEKAYQLQPSEDVKTVLLAIYRKLKMDSKLKGLK